jgi:hypothetical protein
MPHLVVHVFVDVKPGHEEAFKVWRVIQLIY